MEKDHNILAEMGEGAGTSHKNMGQGDFLVSTEVIISNSLRMSLGPIQTKIFDNLCVPEKLDEWNEMQADSDYIIISEKSLTPPARSTVTIEPYKVTYRKVDTSMFDLVLLANAVKGSMDVQMFLSIFKSEEYRKYAMLIIDADPEALNTMMDMLLKVLTKYPVPLIIKQRGLFESKIAGIMGTLEKDSTPMLKPKRKNNSKKGSAKQKVVTKKQTPASNPSKGKK